MKLLFVNLQCLNNSTEYVLPLFQYRTLYTDADNHGCNAKSRR